MRTLNPVHLPRGLAVLSLWTASAACSPSATSSCDTDACEVETDTDAVDPNEPNLAFVTALPVNLSHLAQPGTAADGAARASHWCWDAAQQAGLPGTYRPWFASADVESPATLLRDASGWVRLDGKPLAATAEDLLVGNLLHPLSVDEYGMDHAAEDLLVRTDVGFSGDPELCAAGSASSMSGRWASLYSALECEQAHVYCFGIDRQAALSAPEQSGRRSFVSRQTFAGDAGVGAFDQACQSEADAAALGGQFVAFVAADGESALQRVGPGGPWVTLRGQPLRGDGADLNAPGPLDAAVSTHADGEVADTLVLTGAAAPDKLPESRNCDNWTSNVGGSAQGLSGSVTEWFFVDMIFACNDERPVMCFEI